MGHFISRDRDPNRRSSTQNRGAAVGGRLKVLKNHVSNADCRRNRPEPSSLGHDALAVLLLHKGQLHGGSRDSDILSSVRSLVCTWRRSAGGGAVRKFSNNVGLDVRNRQLCTLDDRRES